MSSRRRSTPASRFTSSATTCALRHICPRRHAAEDELGESHPSQRHRDQLRRQPHLRHRQSNTPRRERALRSRGRFQLRLRSRCHDAHGNRRDPARRLRSPRRAGGVQGSDDRDENCYPEHPSRDPDRRSGNRGEEEAVQERRDLAPRQGSGRPISRCSPSPFQPRSPSAIR